MSKREPRCKSCRWWERSGNYAAADRDWGSCHFWGSKEGHAIPSGFIDYSVGHEPRGSDTCGFHNADPALKGTIPATLAPREKCEGDVR